MKRYKVIGVMSGTSMDGLDVALCEFIKKDDNWEGKICSAITQPYSKEWKDKLWNAYTMSGIDLCLLDMEYGKYIGTVIKDFVKKHKKDVDLIASHGHTIFHRPDLGLTYQIGNGSAIAAETSISTVSDFRKLDVALNGQGAPLVPIGDMLLFKEFDYCLNLGGFANISYNWYNKRIAFDICPVNFVINKLAGLLDKEMDYNGELAKQGVVDNKLLKLLNKLPFYEINPPKSLGREWVEDEFMPLLDSSGSSIHDKLRTVYEHIAFQLNKVITGASGKKILITGGGAHNKYLIQLIENTTKRKTFIPDKLIVDYKEAYVFAFLGALRLREENNCISSVTGAKHDNIGGIIFKI